MLASLVAIAISIAAISPPTDEIPVDVTRLSEKVIVLRVGKNYITNVTALSTSKGIVVIDTNNIPSLAEKLRRIIERELNRSDFACVINTHGHWDHTNGNQVFTDTTIVGHENCVPAMREFEKGLADVIKRRKQRIEILEAELTELETDSDQGKWLADLIAEQKKLIPELQGGLVITPPILTFNDRLTLFLGDMTLNLIYSSGKVHTDSDILIQVPEEGLLFVGDLMAKKWLPYISSTSDIPKWLKLLDRILSDGSEIKHVVTGHHELMTAEDVLADSDYIRAVWDGVATARKEGKSLEETKSLLSFEKAFNHLSHRIHVWEEIDYHVTNIETVWEMQEE